MRTCPESEQARSGRMTIRLRPDHPAASVPIMIDRIGQMAPHMYPIYTVSQKTTPPSCCCPIPIVFGTNVTE